MSAFIVPMADEAHANGMPDRRIIRELAREHFTPLPIPHIHADGKRYWEDYHGFHGAYDAGVSLIQSSNDLGRVVAAYLESIALQGAVYIDILSSNMNNIRGGDPWPRFKENTDAVLAAMQNAESKFGIKSSLVLTAKRHLEDGPARAMDLLELGGKYKKKGYDEHNRFRGFHMAGDETVADIALFDPVFKAAPDFGFKILGTHAGEMKRPEGVKDVRGALGLPGTNRGTHLLCAPENQDLMDELYWRKFYINLPIICNEILQPERFINPEDHPIRKMFNHGIPIGLGTDDPGVLDITISDVYRAAHLRYGFSRSELLLLTVNTVRHGFGLPEERQIVLDGLKSFNHTHRLGLPDEVFDLNRSVDLRQIVREIAITPVPGLASISKNSGLNTNNLNA